MNKLQGPGPRKRMPFGKNKHPPQHEILESLDRHSRLSRRYSELSQINAHERIEGIPPSVSEDDIEYVGVGLDIARRKATELVRKAGILPRPQWYKPFNRPPRPTSEDLNNIHLTLDAQPIQSLEAPTLYQGPDAQAA